MHRLDSPRCLLIAALAICAVISRPASARTKKHHSAPRNVVRAAPPPVAADAQPGRPSSDDLYRRRGYGIGGPIFGGDTALAGTCADLRFAEPDSCGRGYGIYGNGLGTRFGR